MITNTCLTGGSFELDSPAAGPVDPLAGWLELGDGEVLPPPDVAGEVDFCGWVAAGAGSGVGSEVAAGGSAPDSAAEGDEDEEGDVGEADVARAEEAAGRMSFRRGRAEAAST
jgi:hypothetical protein